MNLLCKILTALCRPKEKPKVSFPYVKIFSNHSLTITKKKGGTIMVSLLEGQEFTFAWGAPVSARGKKVAVENFKAPSSSDTVILEVVTPNPETPEDIYSGVAKFVALGTAQVDISADADLDAAEERHITDFIGVECIREEASGFGAPTVGEPRDIVTDTEPV